MRSFLMWLFLLVCSSAGAGVFAVLLFNLGSTEAWWKYAVCIVFIVFFVLIYTRLMTEDH